MRAMLIGHLVALAVITILTLNYMAPQMESITAAKVNQLELASK